MSFYRNFHLSALLSLLIPAIAVAEFSQLLKQVPSSANYLILANADEICRGSSGLGRTRDPGLLERNQIMADDRRLESLQDRGGI